MRTLIIGGGAAGLYLAALCPSAVILEKDAGKAIRALHSVFFFSSQTLSLGLYGPGNIGGTFLDQIEKERDRLKKVFDLDIRVRGIANSTRMLLSEDGLDLSSWRMELNRPNLPSPHQTYPMSAPDKKRIRLRPQPPARTDS